MNKRLEISLSVLVALLVSMSVVIWPMPSAAAGSTYYVSPQGNDTSGQGTQASPWRTISYAVSKAAAGDTIKVMDDDNEATDDYVENVVVNMSLTVERYDNVGANPQVKASAPADPVFLVAADYVTIRGLDVYGSTTFDSGLHTGIYLGNSRYCTVENNRCGWDSSHTNRVGIAAGNFNVVTGNTIEFCALVAIDAGSCNTITGNSASTCPLGGVLMALAGINVSGSANVVSGNTVFNNATTAGIFLWGPGVGNTVTGNTCASNREGILVGGNGHTISNNTVTSNGTGIIVGGNNVIAGNTVVANTGLGICLRSDSNSTIYLNSFSGNSAGNVQAETTSSKWSSPEEITYTYRGKPFKGYVGNYYSDYIGADDGSGGRRADDGIGDTNIPYAIGGASDYYPLMDASGVKADFSASPKSGMSPLNVKFTDKSIGDVDTWAWDFDNDGAVDSTLQNPQHTYTVPGAYTVKLTVKGALGEDTRTRTAYIIVINPLVWKTVSPNSQNTVQTPDQSITLEFPEGAVEEETEVIIGEGLLAEAPTAPSGYKFGGTYFVVAGAENLANDVTVIVKYSDDDLAAAGETPNTLTLSYYDDDLGEWVTANTAVDESEETLTTTTRHFSKWMVMAEEAGSSGSPFEFPVWGWVVVGVAGLLAAIGVSFGLGYKLAKR